MDAQSRIEKVLVAKELLLNERETAALHYDKPITAIKMLRERTDSSLLSARLAVEKYREAWESLKEDLNR